MHVTVRVNTTINIQPLMKYFETAPLVGDRIFVPSMAFRVVRRSHDAHGHLEVLVEPTSATSNARIEEAFAWQREVDLDNGRGPK